MSRSMTADGYDFNTLRTEVSRRVRRRWMLGGAILLGLLGYLTYTWYAFGVPDLLERSKPERAVLLATDSIAHKVHVTKLLRREIVSVAIEGERTATYETPPPWVALDDKNFSVDLKEGYRVEVDGSRLTFRVPDYGVIKVAVSRSGVQTTLPEGKDAPEWLRATKAKFDARPTLGRRVQATRAKIEVHRFFLGWENFWFPFRSELHGLSFGELVDLAFSDQRLNEEMPNAAYIFDSFWNNPDWQHGNVFVALLETLLMAVLGTLTAVIFGLPLAILAARNFSPSGALRFVVRRLFDMLRGIDNLIWALIFIRAFGLGPLTGALAIAFTDTGTLGKLFSEALENIDKNQMEGVRSTGAGKLQLYRFGVIPQILPILVSQTLYYLESNTRSATVIGALGAGGIGLMLVETLRTSRDWENTLYIIILTVILVVAMDRMSAWLRGKLIQGKGDGR